VGPRMKSDQMSFRNERHGTQTKALGWDGAARPHRCRRAADGARLGRAWSTFMRAWAVDETPCFSELLRAIDEADREIRRSRSN
jgi:hypothetical protein